MYSRLKDSFRHTDFRLHELLLFTFSFVISINLYVNFTHDSNITTWRTLSYYSLASYLITFLLWLFFLRSYIRYAWELFTSRGVNVFSFFIVLLLFSATSIFFAKSSLIIRDQFEGEIYYSSNRCKIYMDSYIYVRRKHYDTRAKNKIDLYNGDIAYLSSKDISMIKKFYNYKIPDSPYVELDCGDQYEIVYLRQNRIVLSLEFRHK